MDGSARPLDVIRSLNNWDQGGMALVYKVFDTRLDVHVAVKVIRVENILPRVLERSLKRFEREAKALINTLAVTRPAVLAV